MRKFIRKIIVHLYESTNHWVIPKTIWERLDAEDETVSDDLDTIAKDYHDDPEYGYAMGMVNFMFHYDP